MSHDYRLEKFYNLAREMDPEENPLKKELKDPERYKDLKEVGRGGMKVVYKALDNQTNRHVALAKLQINKDKRQFEAFIREARLTAKLEHPNIINIYDVGLNEKDNPYFTMELKSGDNLNDILKKLSEGNKTYQECYPLEDLLQIFVKVCDAISYAHSKKIIHLDLKPENIQVGTYGEVMVCDWGICKIYDKEFETEGFNNIEIDSDLMNSVTLHGDIKGSPGFMAPEQIKAERGKDPQTDVFSLGCILYSILTFEKPFVGAKLEDVLVNTLKGEFKKPSVRVPKAIPESLEAVVLKAVSVEKEDRYSSVADLKAEVENYLTGYVTSAEEAGFGKILRLFILRNKVLSFTVFAALITIISIIWVSFEEIKEEKQKAEQNLASAIKQKAETDRVTKEFYQEMMSKQLQLYGVKFKEDMLQSLNKSLSRLHAMEETYPEVKEVSAPIGYLYFIKQDFEKSYSYLKQYAGIYEYMLPLLEKFLPRIQSGKLLSKDDFIELLNDVEPIKSLHFKLLYYYAENCGSLNDYLTVVKDMIRKVNPNWDEELFDYNHEERKLVLGGAGLVALNWRNHSLLDFISIRFLHLKCADLKSLSGLEELDFSDLNIRNTQVYDIKELERLDYSRLKRLYINRNQFSAVDLAKLPKELQLKISRSRNN